MNATWDDPASHPKVVANNLAFGIFNIGLAIATVCLNLATIIAYINSKVLKSKMPYFMITMLSFNDFLVGLVPNVLFAAVLLGQYSSRRTNQCLSAIQLYFLLFFSGCSFKTLVVMSWERYAAICHPLFHRTKVTRKRLMKCLIFLWLLAVIGTILSWRLHRFLEYVIIPELLCFNILLVYFYVKIYLANLNSSKNFRQREGFNQGADQASWNEERRKVMLNVNLAISCFLAVMSFVICYLPSSIAAILKTSFSDDARVMVDIWATTLVLLNSSLNSIVFFWRSKPLRREVRAVLRIIFHQNERRKADNANDCSIARANVAISAT